MIPPDRRNPCVRCRSGSNGSLSFRFRGTASESVRTSVRHSDQVRLREGELRTSDLSTFPTKFRVGFRPSRKFGPKIDRIELVETGLRLFDQRRPVAGCREQLHKAFG